MQDGFERLPTRHESARQVCRGIARIPAIAWRASVPRLADLSRAVRRAPLRSRNDDQSSRRASRTPPRQSPHRAATNPPPLLLGGRHRALRSLARSGRSTKGYRATKTDNYRSGLHAGGKSPDHLHLDAGGLRGRLLFLPYRDTRPDPESFSRWNYWAGAGRAR